MLSVEGRHLQQPKPKHPGSDAAPYPKSEPWALYREILKLSYRDYFEKKIVPYYREKGLGVDAEAKLAKAGDLRTYETALRGNPKVRLIVNQNDFLLEEVDLAWLRAIFGDELTSFKMGGHLGNLSNDAVQEAILNALTPIRGL